MRRLHVFRAGREAVDRGAQGRYAQEFVKAWLRAFDLVDQVVHLEYLPGAVRHPTSPAGYRRMPVQTPPDWPLRQMVFRDDRLKARRVQLWNIRTNVRRGPD